MFFSYLLDHQFGDKVTGCSHRELGRYRMDMSEGRSYARLPKGLNCNCWVSAGCFIPSNLFVFSTRISPSLVRNLQKCDVVIHHIDDHPVKQTDLIGAFDLIDNPLATTHPQFFCRTTCDQSSNAILGLVVATGKLKGTGPVPLLMIFPPFFLLKFWCWFHWLWIVNLGSFPHLSMYDLFYHIWSCFICHLSSRKCWWFWTQDELLARAIGQQASTICVLEKYPSWKLKNPVENGATVEVLISGYCSCPSGVVLIRQPDC